MTQPNIEVASTVSGATQFGSTWRAIVYHSELPSTREDSMNSRSRRDSTVPRTMRVTDGVYARPSARMMPYLLAPTTASSPSASSRPGKASRALLKAMMMRSVQPRTKPVSTPIAVPSTTANDTVSRLIQTLVDAPTIRRLSTSRPNSSVPSQNCALGGLSRDAKLMPSGSRGVHTAPSRAAARTMAMMAPPTAALAGRRRRRVFAGLMAVSSIWGYSAPTRGSKAG
ncbi:hypothetical protein D9M68_447440 [compost metagenome]